MNNDRAAGVVRLWRAVEMFSPQDVPKLTPAFSADATLTVLDLAAGELAPWQDGHPVTARPLRRGMTWQFIVYGGMYDVTRATDELLRVFGEDGRPADGRRSGRTALFAFTVNAEGSLVENSATLSACAW
ncbi:DNA helicase, partial [Kibdelosporangium lantanae]